MDLQKSAAEDLNITIDLPVNRGLVTNSISNLAANVHVDFDIRLQLFAQ